MKKSIFPNGIKPIAPYSPGVVIGNMLFISGQIAINPENGNLVIDNIENETHQVMKNLFQVLKEGGFEPEHLVKITIFMSDMSYYEVVNRIYSEYFQGVSIYPAREAVAVKTLPRNVNVEISGIAVKN
jgi:2-iminobutanoate/2-iminopropanoate deaminase